MFSANSKDLFSVVVCSQVFVYSCVFVNLGLFSLVFACLVTAV